VMGKRSVIEGEVSSSDCKNPDRRRRKYWGLLLPVLIGLSVLIPQHSFAQG
jgi:hypothetical protein